MEFKSIGNMYDSIRSAVKGEGGKVEVTDERALRGEVIDNLIYNGVFNEEEIVREARQVIKGIADVMGIKPASIQNLYEAMGRGECGGFTVPAINIRGLTYDVARAVFRAAMKHNVGAFIFEIAKSEIGYTQQRPSEYTACVLASAIKEGYRGCVFIQETISR